MKRILLIGGTGTISTSITELLATDPEVKLTVMNRGHKPIPENVEQILCDVFNSEEMDHALNGRTFDIVVDFLIYDPRQADARIRQFQGNVEQFVMISTVCVFDHEASVVLKEDSIQNNRFSEYGRAKAECERRFRAAVDFPCTIVRPSQTYGFDRFPLSVKGKTCWTVINRILQGKPVIVHGDGTGIWHSMHTEDFAKNFVPLLGNPKTIGGSINLVNPECATWNEIYQQIATQLNRPLQLVPIASEVLAESKIYDHVSGILGDKQYSNLYDPTICNEWIPNFACSISIEEGFQKYLAYMDAHPEGKAVDETYDAWCDEMIQQAFKLRRTVKESSNL